MMLPGRAGFWPFPSEQGVQCCMFAMARGAPGRAPASRAAAHPVLQTCVPVPSPVCMPGTRCSSPGRGVGAADTAAVCACRRCGRRPGGGRRLGASAGEGLASSTPANRSPAALHQAPQEREQPAQGEVGAAPRPAAQSPAGGRREDGAGVASGSGVLPPAPPSICPARGGFPWGRRSCCTEGSSVGSSARTRARRAGSAQCWCVPARLSPTTAGSGRWLMETDQVVD